MAQQLKMGTLCEDGWRTQVEEVMSLRSIYCKPSECTLHPPYNFDTLEQIAPDQFHEPICLTLYIECQAHNRATSLSARFELPNGYPALSPCVSLSSDQLCARTLLGLQDDVKDYVTVHCKEPCIFSVAEFLREKLHSVVSTELVLLPALPLSVIKCNPKPPQSKPLVAAQGNTVCILHVDHIRCEAKYFKALKSWSQGLSVHGKVIHAGVHYIYVILIGRNESLQEFLHRWRAALIDVDSRGRPCKERLMSILCRQHMDDNQQSERYD